MAEKRRSDVERPHLWGIKPGEAAETGAYVSDELGWWFTGLVDGEGCFSISTNKAQFIVAMRLDDRPMIERIREDLGGIGSLYVKDKLAEAPRRPGIRWEVVKRDEVLWLTRFFDFFELRSKKRRDYEIWREAVIDWYCSGSPAVFEQYIVPIKQARKYREPDDGQAISNPVFGI
ncbi:MAG: LAGLIDADG family homing endonuclease [Gemmatimonadota bacterium]